MNKLLYLFQYFLSSYTHTNKVVAPLAVWCIFQGFFYNVFPVSIVSSTAVSGIALFLVMNWVGFNYYDLENPVAEQLLCLRVKSHTFYNLAKTAFLFLIGICFAGIGIVIPQVQNIIHGFGIFTRPVTVYDVAVSLLVLLMMTGVSVVTGGFFQARMIKDRKLASLLITLVSIIAVVKEAVVRQFPLLKVIALIFPPIDNSAERLADKMYYMGDDLLYIFIRCFLFGAVGLLIQMYVLNKRKF